MSYWEFFDFVDDRGVNQVHAWLDDLRDGVREEVRDRLEAKIWIARQTQHLGFPLFTPRKGRGRGLYEMKFTVRKVPQRPLACLGPEAGQVTILAGAHEHNDQLRPPNIEKTALARKTQINVPGRVTKHVLYKRSTKPKRQTGGGPGSQV